MTASLPVATLSQALNFSFCSLRRSRKGENLYFVSCDALAKVKICFLFVATPWQGLFFPFCPLPRRGKGCFFRFVRCHAVARVNFSVLSVATLWQGLFFPFCPLPRCGKGENLFFVAFVIARALPEAIQHGGVDCFTAFAMTGRASPTHNS